VAEKLEKLLKMLSSPQEGEVVAAAQAIMRTLKSAGADIHELAACVKGGGKLSKADMQRIYDEAYRRGKDAAAANANGNAGFHNVEPTSLYDMACELKDRCFDRLDERDRALINTIVRWYANKEPSEKQAVWLHDIYRRTRRWR
jgi:hypothetical protein